MPEAPIPGTAGKSKRRWLQFRLRTLLIVMTLFALWLGLKVDRVNRQRRAVQALTEWTSVGDVQLHYDYQKVPNPGMRWDTRAEPPGPQWLRQLVGEHYFITPVLLAVEDQGVIDETGLAFLDDLPDLEEVYLGPRINREMRLRDGDLAHLKHLTKLRELHFGRDTLSGPDGPRRFDFLSNCRRLEELCAPHSHFGDADLEHLRRARNLRILLLNNTLVGDDGLAHLKRLTKLEMLELSRTKVTDAGLAHLGSLSKLTYLGLIDDNVTDAGLDHLKGLTGLTHLQLTGTRVTAEGVKDLQSALPNCRID
jgi:hypothetical protein